MMSGIRCILAAVLVAATAFLDASHLRAANVVSDDPESGIIRLSGPLNFFDFIEIEEAVKQSRRRQVDSRVTLQLHSPGGSVETALKIARYVRANDIQTVVPLGGRCFSSCVLIFMAGVDRTPAGDVGIHRPYFDEIAPDKSRAEIDRLVKRMIEDLRAFAREMNVSPQIVDDMMAVRPENMRVLTWEDLDRYGAVGRDPAYDENQTAIEASGWGLTSAEYRSRKAAAERFCHPLSESFATLPAWARCVDLHVSKLPPALYDERQERFRFVAKAGFPTLRATYQCRFAIFMKGAPSC